MMGSKRRFGIDNPLLPPERRQVTDEASVVNDLLLEVTRW